MAKKQDRQGVRTAAELERKYNLGQSVTPEFVQSTVKSSVAVATNDCKNYVDSKVKDVTVQEEKIAALEKSDDEMSKSISDLEQAYRDLSEVVSGLGGNVTPGNGSSELLVTVEADSLATENLTSDKTFAEIEEAILDGKNVRVKLICNGVDHHIYLQVTSHLQGSEIAFFGYFNNLPLVLKIMAD